MKTDKLTVTIQKLSDGKIRVTGKGYFDYNSIEEFNFYFKPHMHKYNIVEI